MTKLRTVDSFELADLETAMARLKTARDHATWGGAKQAVKAISRAAKSLEGALRHARRAWDAQQRQASQAAVAEMAKGA